LFQAAGIESAGFIVSNNLDAHTIASLMRQTDQIAAFGVGTNAVTIKNSPGCVYKTVAAIAPDGSMNAVIKLSGEPDKTTIPGPQQVYRLSNGDGVMLADLITEMGEALPPAGALRMYGPFFRQHRTRVTYTSCRRMLHKYVEQGQLIRPLPPLMEVRETSWERFERELHPGHRRLENPHVYRVGMSRRLHERRERMIAAALGEDGDLMEEV
jgi:nicotinate phosphoribosyltransferase